MMINQKEEILGLKDCTEQALDHSSLQVWQGVLTTQCLDQTPSKNDEWLLSHHVTDTMYFISDVDTSKKCMCRKRPKCLLMYRPQTSRILLTNSLIVPSS